MQALRLKPLRINNIITTPLIKPEALLNKERPRLYISAFPQPPKSGSVRKLGCNFIKWI